MQEQDNTIEASLAGLSQAAWKQRIEDIAEENGMFQPLGPRHFATFIDEKPTLLVTFETVQGIRALSDTARPFGFDMVRAQGWSHLCVVSDGDTWFRNPKVYGFFDRLIDDGFFEDFRQVVFYGAGPCGYAAAAFSVAAPGATVIAVQPQATLEPRRTEWDDRFPQMRRTSFTDRYGFAPEMLDAVQAAFVLYDPRETQDAMHATLFDRPGVHRLRLTNMGDSLQTRLIEMNILYPMLTLAGRGKLTETAFHRLYRARRENVTYLRRLLARLDADGRSDLATLLCRNVTARMNAPKFRRRLDQLEAESGPDPEDRD